MRIGIGLPNPVPNTEGRVHIEWAKRPEAAGSRVGRHRPDRVSQLDSLTTLAAAAAVTEHVSLMSNILLAPIYTPVLLAKTAASIDQISPRPLGGMDRGQRTTGSIRPVC